MAHTKVEAILEFGFGGVIPVGVDGDEFRDSLLDRDRIKNSWLNGR